MNQDVFSPPFNFCGLQSDWSAWDKSRVVIIPVPYDLTTTYMPGTRLGPHAIIKASMQVELFDDELEQETAAIGIHTLPELEVDTSGPAGMIDRVAAAAQQVISAGKFPVMLGGEHSVTLGMIRALLKTHPDMGVLQLDAHADLRDSYLGSPYNHACVAKRIQELCPLVQAGIRNMSAEEFSFLSHAQVKSCSARHMQGNTDWVAKIIENLPQKIYITIDLDVFDPSIMPAVGTPEPGGLGWYEVLNLLRTVCRKRQIVGCDIVELCPQPMNPGPDFLAAKLCYKLLGYIHCTE
jgi:agmatinase